jgi:glycosyltransferase involved in cell wall biosynthesis
MAAPLVSILVPCYNTARYLGETIDSILAQTMRDFELILINDGSSDDTESVLKKYEHSDSRVRSRSRANRGLVETRNELVEMARGQYLAWHDSDDLMTPQRLELQVRRFADEPALAWLGGATALIDPVGLPIHIHRFPTDHESILRMMEREMACYFGSTLMRRELVVRAGGFRHPFAICEDFDLCLRMADLGRVGNLPDVVFYYRQHMASTCNSGRGRFDAYVKLVQALARERRGGGSDRLQRGEPVIVEFDDLPSEHKNRVETHSRWAWWALRAGHVKTARKYALQTMRDAPLNKESWKLFACALRGR